MNFEDRVELRRQNFMKSLFGQPQSREDFQISLRKAKRQNFINTLRTTTKTIQDIEMSNETFFSNLILDHLKSLEFSSSHFELIAKLESINELISEKTIKTLNSNPELTQKLSNYISIQTPDEISYLALKIIFKESKIESCLNLIPIPQLISSLDISKPCTSKMILKIFECYASKSPHNAQTLINAEVHKYILNLLTTETSEFKYSISLIYMHLICNFKLMNFKTYEEIITSYKSLIESNEKNVLIISLYSISQLLEKDTRRIKFFLQLKIINRIIELINHTDIDISNKALKVAGDVTFAEDPQITYLIEQGLLDILSRTTKQSNEEIRTESFYILSNIVASGKDMVEVLLKHDVFFSIIESLSDQNMKVLKEVSFVYMNLSAVASWSQLECFVSNGVFNYMKDALVFNVHQITLNFLKFCDKVMAGACDNKAQFVFDNFLDSGCLELVEKKNKNMNPAIYHVVTSILKYFVSDDNNVNDLMDFDPEQKLPKQFII